jgi:hypothetical protein
MRKYFKPLMIVAAMTTSVSALAIKKILPSTPALIHSWI